MQMHRRSLVQGVLGAGAVVSGLGGGHVALAQGQEATPATPAAVTPEELVRRLRATPITSPLFPRDSGDLTILDWVDEGDTDLEGTVGAFLVQGADIEEPLGAYMVHPSAESAQERFVQQTSDGDDELLLELFGNLAGWGHYSDGTSIVAMVAGPVIVSALGMGAGRGADEPAVRDYREADARALANLAGMLDHLRTVTAPTNPE